MKSGKEDGDEAGSSKSKPSTPTPKPVTPIYYSYPLDQVFSLRDKMVEVLDHEFTGTTPKGPEFRRLVELVLEMLPGGFDYATLETSLRHLAGTQIDKGTLHKTCWRIAGNTKRLRQRRPVSPWHVQKLPEWVPAQVVSCRRQKNAKEKMGGMFGFRILAGTSCPLFCYKWWSLQYCRFISNEFGFSRKRGRNPPKYPYTDPEQFVNMRLYLKIDPDECDKEPGFSEIAFSPSMSDWNAVTRKCRQRTQPGFECQMGVRVASELPCWKCPVGYRNCRAGTHRLDWEQRHCPHCGEDDAWFDPDHQGDMCVECYTKDVYGRSKNA